MRHVALLGHHSADIARLIQALAAATSGHSAIMDGSPTITVTTLRWRGETINVLAAAQSATPPALPSATTAEAPLLAMGADAAVFVLGATAGVDGATIAAWESYAESAVPRAIAVTGIEAPGADVDETAAICRRVFSESVVNRYLPVFGEASDDAGSTHPVLGLLDLLRWHIADYSAGMSPIYHNLDPEHARLAQPQREELIELVLTEAEDDALLHTYLADPAHTPDVAALEADIARSVGWSLHPIVPIAIPSHVGFTELLDTMLQCFPDSRAAVSPPLRNQAGGPHDPLPADPSGPLLGLILAADSDNARKCFIRIYSGSLQSGGEVHLGYSDGDGVHWTSARIVTVESLDTDIAPSDAGTAGGSCHAQLNISDPLSSANLVGATISSAATPLLIAPLSDVV